MSKKNKKKVVKKVAAKPAETASPAVAEDGAKGSAYLIRAIRIKPEMLDAARAYKKATGVSFYRLGEESIAARLTKEGYLKEPTVAKA